MYQQLDMQEFDVFYQILKDHFPKKEVKEYEYLKRLFITKKAKAIIQKEGNTIIGAICYMDLKEYVFVDYLVIIDGYQGQKLGEKLLQYFKKQINKPIILEVEFPEDEITKRRIVFYQRQGFILNDHRYEVPPVRSLKHSLFFLLMTYPDALNKEEYEIIYPRILKTIYEIDEI